jgi:hypothetical protein
METLTAMVQGIKSTGRPAKGKTGFIDSQEATATGGRAATIG